MTVAFLIAVTMVLALAVVAFCAGAETGFLSVRRGRIIHMAREGGVRAKVIHEAIGDMGRTTTALLVGNNLASVTYSSASAVLIPILVPESSVLATCLSVASALLLLFVGEFLPKLFCAARPLCWLLHLAPLWQVFAHAFVPIGSLVQMLVERLMPTREVKTRITPEAVLRTLQDRKDGVKLSDFESALVGRIMVLRAKGESITPEALLAALDTTDL